MTDGGHRASVASRGNAPASLELIAVGFGLLTGLIEAAIIGGLQYAPHRYLLISSDVVWMAPMADAAILLSVALGLRLVGLAAPRLISPRVIIFLLTFASLFSIAFIFHPQFDKYASMVLALGLAVQVERLIRTYPERFRVLAQRAPVCLLVVIVAVAVGVRGVQLFTERHALAMLPPAREGAPNVLLIVLDTVRAPNLSVYGYARPTTPALERFAQAGVRFDRAFSTAPWTLPSHASMLTGRFPHELSADWLAPLDGTYPTLAEVFGAHGYATAGFIANTWYCSRKKGLSRGFAHYEDYRVTLAQIVQSSSLARYVIDSPRLRRLVGYYQNPLARKYASEINREILEWLSHKGPQPFFVFLNYTDAHGPYLPPAPFDRMFGTRPIGEWKPWLRRQDASPQEIQAMMDAYDGAIASLDHNLGMLFDELAKRGQMANTLVVITADHGEEFGEHDIFDHGNSLYLASVHVPLLLAMPGRIPAGTSVSAPVTLRDLAATILDLVGLQGEVRFPGTSLTHYWSTGAPNAGSTLLSEVNWARHVPDWLPVSKGDMKSLIADGWRYIRDGDGREELYDFDHDAAERHDLAKSDSAQDTLRSCRAVLNRSLSLHAPQ